MKNPLFSMLSILTSKMKGGTLSAINTIMKNIPILWRFLTQTLKSVSLSISPASPAVLTAILVGLFFVACHSEGLKEDQIRIEPERQVAIECLSDFDCDIGYGCVEGNCAAKTVCKTDEQCAPTEACLDYRCVDAGSACLMTSDCEDGLYCHDGRCVVGGRSCISDENCAQEQACINGLCLFSSGECTVHADCKTDELCISSVCTAGGINCKSDDECDNGWSCINKICAPAGASCKTNENCALNEYCDDIFKVCTLKADMKNHAPTIKLIDGINVAHVDFLYTLSVSASDADGDNLTYFMSNAPEGAKIESSTGQFEWKPTPQQTGVHEITFKVSDGKLSVSKDFKITVSALPQPNSDAALEDAIVEFKVEGSEDRWTKNFEDMGKGFYSGALYNLTETGSPLVGAFIKDGEASPAENVTVINKVDDIIFHVQRDNLKGTPQIYKHDNIVKTVFELVDAGKRPVKLGSKNITVQVIVDDQPCPGLVKQIGKDPIYSASITVPPKNFPAAGGKSKIAQLKISAGGTNVTKDIELVPAQPSIVIGEGQTGMILPQYPLYEGDKFWVEIVANSKESNKAQKITQYAFAITYDEKQLTYKSVGNSSDTFSWGDIPKPSQTPNTVSFSNGSTTGTALISNRYVKLAKIQFEVKKVSKNGTAALSGKKTALLKFASGNTNLGTQNEKMIVADRVNASAKTGNVFTIEKPVIGIFAWPTKNHLYDMSLLGLTADSGEIVVKSLNQKDPVPKNEPTATLATNDGCLVTNGLKYSAAKTCEAGELTVSFNGKTFSGIKIAVDKLIEENIEIDTNSVTFDAVLNKITGTDQFQSSEINVIWVVNKDLSINITKDVKFIVEGKQCVKITQGVVSAKANVNETCNVKIDKTGISQIYEVSTQEMPISELRVVVPATIGLYAGENEPVFNPNPVELTSGLAIAKAFVTREFVEMDKVAPLVAWAFFEGEQGKRYNFSNRVNFNFENQAQTVVAWVNPANKNKIKSSGVGETKINAQFEKLQDINSTGGMVSVKLPNVEKLVVTPLPAPAIARSTEDPAKLVRGLKTSVQLKVEVVFEDGSKWDATNDPDTKYSYEGNLVTIDKSGLVSATGQGAGKASITIELPKLQQSKEYEIWVVSLEGLDIKTTEDFDVPSDASTYKSSNEKKITAKMFETKIFNKIAGLNDYQRGRIYVDAIWTDTKATNIKTNLVAATKLVFDNIAQAPFNTDKKNGFYRIIPKQNSDYELNFSYPLPPAYKLPDVLAKKDIVISGDTIDLTTLFIRGTGPNFSPLAESTHKNESFDGTVRGMKDSETTFNVIGLFSDGTRYYFVENGEQKEFKSYLQFDLTQKPFAGLNVEFPNAAANDIYAVLTPQKDGLSIKDNGAVLVNVSRNNLKTSYNLATNLDPMPNDMDIGSPTGRFVELLEAGEFVILPVRINSGNKKLKGYTVEFEYDKDILSTSTKDVTAVLGSIDVNVESGKIKFGGVISNNPPKGINEVARIKFKALKDKKKFMKLKGKIYSLVDEKDAGYGVPAGQDFVDSIAATGWVDPEGDIDGDKKFALSDILNLQSELNIKESMTINESPQGNYDQKIPGEVDFNDVFRGRQMTVGLFHYMDFEAIKVENGTYQFKAIPYNTKMTLADLIAKKFHDYWTVEQRSVRDISFLINSPSNPELNGLYPATFKDNFFITKEIVFPWIDLNAEVTIVFSKKNDSDPTVNDNEVYIPHKVKIFGLSALPNACSNFPPCSQGKICVMENNSPKCVNKCVENVCPDGETCNPANGKCMKDLQLCSGVSCADGKSCDEIDGICKDACTGISCTAGECDLGTGECVVKCISTLNCADKQQCINDICQAIPSCTEASDCSNGQLCIGGDCLGSDSCKTNNDCFPLACEDGVCTSSVCSQTISCPITGQLCIDGYCLHGGACTDKNDCTEDQLCLDGSCQGGGACKDSSECPPYQLCENDEAQNGTCVTRKLCIEGDQNGCPDGQECKPYSGYSMCMDMDANVPPSFTDSISSELTYEKNTYNNFMIKAEDDDGDSMKFYMDVPDDIGESVPSLNEDTGLFEWTPSIEGNFTFTLKACDLTSFGETHICSSKNVSITVTDEIVIDGEPVDGAHLEFKVEDSLLGSWTGDWWNSGLGEGKYQGDIFDISNIGQSTLSASYDDEKVSDSTGFYVKGTPEKLHVIVADDTVYAGRKIYAFVMATDKHNRPVNVDSIEFKIDGATQSGTPAQYSQALPGIYRQTITAPILSDYNDPIRLTAVAGDDITSTPVEVKVVEKPASLKLEPATAGAQLPVHGLIPEETFIIPIKVNTGEKNLVGVNFKITIPEEFKLLKVEKGTNAEDFMDYQIPDGFTNGELTLISATGKTPISGISLEMAKIYLKVLTPQNKETISTFEGNASLSGIDNGKTDYYEDTSLYFADLSGETVKEGKTKILSSKTKGLFAWAKDSYIYDLSDITKQPAPSLELAAWASNPHNDRKLVDVSKSVVLSPPEQNQKPSYEEVEANQVTWGEKKYTLANVHVELSDETLDLIAGIEPVRQTARAYAYVETDTGKKIDVTEYVKFNSNQPNQIKIVQKNKIKATANASPDSISTISVTGSLHSADATVGKESYEPSLYITVPGHVVIETLHSILLENLTFADTSHAIVTNVMKNYGQVSPLTYWLTFDEKGKEIWMELDKSEITDLLVSDSSVVELDENNHTITAQANGKANITAEWNTISGENPVEVSIPVPDVVFDGCVAIARAKNDPAAILRGDDFPHEDPTKTTISIKTAEGVHVPIKKIKFKDNDAEMSESIQNNIVNATAAEGNVTVTSMQKASGAVTIVMDVDNFLGLKDQKCNMDIVSLRDIIPTIYEDFDLGEKGAFDKAVKQPKDDQDNVISKKIENTNQWQRTRLVLKAKWTDDKETYIDESARKKIFLAIYKPTFTKALEEVAANPNSNWPAAWRLIPLGSGTHPITFSLTAGLEQGINKTIPFAASTETENIEEMTFKGWKSSEVDEQSQSGDITTDDRFDGTLTIPKKNTAALRVYATYNDKTRYDLYNENGVQNISKFVKLTFSEIIMPAMKEGGYSPSTHCKLITESLVTLIGNGAVEIEASINQDFRDDFIPVTYRLAVNETIDEEGSKPDVDIGQKLGRFVPVIKAGDVITLPIRVFAGKDKKLDGFSIDLQYWKGFITDISFEKSDLISTFGGPEIKNIKGAWSPLKLNGLLKTPLSGIVEVGNLKFTVAKLGASKYTPLKGTITASYSMPDGSSSSAEADISAGAGYIDPPPSTLSDMAVKDYDLNGDDKYNISDVRMVQDKITNSKFDQKADYNLDNRLDTTDLRLALQIDLGTFFFVGFGSETLSENGHKLSLRAIAKDDTPVTDANIIYTVKSTAQKNSDGGMNLNILKDSADNKLSTLKAELDTAGGYNDNGYYSVSTVPLEYNDSPLIETTIAVKTSSGPNIVKIDNIFENLQGLSGSKPCVSNTDCGEAMLCQEGKCAPPVDGECTLTAQCNSGYKCDTNTNQCTEDPFTSDEEGDGEVVEPGELPDTGDPDNGDTGNPGDDTGDGSDNNNGNDVDLDEAPPTSCISSTDCEAEESCEEGVCKTLDCNDDETACGHDCHKSCTDKKLMDEECACNFINCSEDLEFKDDLNFADGNIIELVEENEDSIVNMIGMEDYGKLLSNSCRSWIESCKDNKDAGNDTNKYNPCLKIKAYCLKDESNRSIFFVSSNGEDTLFSGAIDYPAKTIHHVMKEIEERVKGVKESCENIKTDCNPETYNILVMQGNYVEKDLDLQPATRIFGGFTFGESVDLLDEHPSKSVRCLKRAVKDTDGKFTTSISSGQSQSSVFTIGKVDNSSRIDGLRISVSGKGEDAQPAILLENASPTIFGNQIIWNMWKLKKPSDESLVKDTTSFLKNLFMEPPLKKENIYPTTSPSSVAAIRIIGSSNVILENNDIESGYYSKEGTERQIDRLTAIDFSVPSVSKNNLVINKDATVNKDATIKRNRIKVGASKEFSAGIAFQHGPKTNPGLKVISNEIDVGVSKASYGIYLSGIHGDDEECMENINQAQMLGPDTCSMPWVNLYDDFPRACICMYNPAHSDCMNLGLPKNSPQSNPFSGIDPKMSGQGAGIGKSLIQGEMPKCWPNCPPINPVDPLKIDGGFDQMDKESLKKNSAPSLKKLKGGTSRLFDGAVEGLGLLLTLGSECHAQDPNICGLQPSCSDCVMLNPQRYAISGKEYFQQNLIDEGFSNKTNHGEIAVNYRWCLDPKCIDNVNELIKNPGREIMVDRNKITGKCTNDNTFTGIYWDNAGLPAIKEEPVSLRNISNNLIKAEGPNAVGIDFINGNLNIWNNTIDASKGVPIRLNKKLEIIRPPEEIGSSSDEESESKEKVLVPEIWNNILLGNKCGVAKKPEYVAMPEVDLNNLHHNTLYYNSGRSTQEICVNEQRYSSNASELTDIFENQDYNLPEDSIAFDVGCDYPYDYLEIYKGGILDFQNKARPETEDGKFDNGAYERR